MHSVLIHSQSNLHVGLLFLIVLPADSLEVRFNNFDPNSFESCYIVLVAFLLFMVPRQDCREENNIFEYFIPTDEALSKQSHVKPFQLVVPFRKDRVI